jgi:hypothetical protein
MMHNTDLAESVAWEPIDITTPTKWYRFFGRRLGSSTIGLAAAFCPSAFFIGIELIRGSSTGFGISLGPVWIGIAGLRARKAQP